MWFLNWIVLIHFFYYKKNLKFASFTSNVHFYTGWSKLIVGHLKGRKYTFRS